MSQFIEKEFNDCECSLYLNRLEKHELRDYFINKLEESKYLDKCLDYLRIVTTIINSKEEIIKTKYDELLYRLSVLFDYGQYDNQKYLIEAFEYFKEQLDDIVYNDTILKASRIYVNIENNQYKKDWYVVFHVYSDGLTRSNEQDLITITIKGDNVYA